MCFSTQQFPLLYKLRPPFFSSSIAFGIMNTENSVNICKMHIVRFATEICFFPCFPPK